VALHVEDASADYLVGCQVCGTMMFCVCWVSSSWDCTVAGPSTSDQAEKESSESKGQSDWLLQLCITALLLLESSSTNALSHYSIISYQTKSGGRNGGSGDVIDCPRSKTGE
jgi:hypothetical protein